MKAVVTRENQRWREFSPDTSDIGLVVYRCRVVLFSITGDLLTSYVKESIMYKSLLSSSLSSTRHAHSLIELMEGHIVYAIISYLYGAHMDPNQEGIAWKISSLCWLSSPFLLSSLSALTHMLFDEEISSLSSRGRARAGLCMLGEHEGWSNLPAFLQDR